MKKLLDIIGNTMPVVAVVVGIVGLGMQLDFAYTAINFRNTDIIFAMMTGVIACATGIFSAYIARKGRNLSKTKRVFLSYSYDTKGEARLLAKALSSRGMKVWFDENDLQPGDNLKASIAAAIESSNAMVALVSGNVGEHARTELSAAVARQVPVYAFSKTAIDKLYLDELTKYIMLSHSDGNVDDIANAVAFSISGRFANDQTVNAS